jgi:hypothetical protein
MAIFIGAVLAVLSIAVIIYPFLKLRFSDERQALLPNEDSEGPALEAVFGDIRTLQLEHQLGKIPPRLYQEQLDAYRIQAAAALKRQMESPARDADWALEQEIMLARANLAQRNGWHTPCPNCGTAVSASQSQCSECGIELSFNAPDPQGAPEE